MASNPIVTTILEHSRRSSPPGTIGERNHPRECENFHPLVPPLGDLVKMSDYVTIPLFSVQVTYFKDSGISIDEYRLRHTGLETLYKPRSLVGPTKKVRATFILSRTNINQLKKRVLTQIPTLEYISSFTVTCGYIWSCIAKSLVKMGEKKGEDALEQFIISVDCRSRMNPPIPSTYLGNCGAPCITTIKNVVLTSENGFVFAAKLISEDINKMVKNKEGILKDAERWHEGFKIPARKISVAGTPKLNFYDIDFGWGKPQKYEAISIDYSVGGSVAINASKESTQDFEIGLSFPNMQMKAFADIFNHGLESEI
ncbi:anthocyanidin 3-O-glucoside-3'',6''-O-dimalonyltransferase [Artemisia annua]|uniref:Anthocyanidin 3-O-glucoside-3'',6''-O-dimalonyltransferase n=1 Tax=Artemisia annua TaxID=35608 RepID=A0A2U1N570_ARTAN|nr:anthocyanidin 3-O-glucoside-3'',6''-O-dimalonyltransferase [Artemisia annua]